MNTRTTQTITIEAMLKNGQQSQLAIARVMGLSKQRVGQIKKRIGTDVRRVAWNNVTAKSMRPIVEEKDVNSLDNLVPGLHLLLDYLMRKQRRR
jgi:hypothetical protein